MMVLDSHPNTLSGPPVISKLHCFPRLFYKHVTDKPPNINVGPRFMLNTGVNHCRHFCHTEYIHCHLSWILGGQGDTFDNSSSRTGRNL